MTNPPKYNTRFAPCCACDKEEAEGYLTRPAEIYLASRRAFLRTALASGLAVALLPLGAEEAQADMFRPSAADQKRLGEQAAQEALRKYREITDSRARSFRKVGETLVGALDPKRRGPWDYRFRVLQSKEVNAFALPGGNMFIHTALLDRIQSADELAGVTAHEIEHVRGEHWARRVEEETKRRLGIAVLLGVTRAGRDWQMVAGAANGLLSLSYSRKDEDSADSNGLQNMVDAGYDPEGMIDLFQTLQKAGGGDGGTPEFLRTHPMTRDRIRRTEARIAKLRGEAPDRR
jgi:predicted Zn-dependent protease